jgi:hypothetical protein
MEQPSEGGPASSGPTGEDLPDDLLAQAAELAAEYGAIEEDEHANTHAHAHAHARSHAARHLDEEKQAQEAERAETIQAIRALPTEERITLVRLLEWSQQSVSVCACVCVCGWEEWKEGR